MKYLIIFSFLLLTACDKVQPETVQRAGVDATVEKLFTVDGCTVYRFYDSGYKRYFTNCKGSVEWRENCGKNCSRSVEVSGGM